MSQVGFEVVVLNGVEPLTLICSGDPDMRWNGSKGVLASRNFLVKPQQMLNHMRHHTPKCIKIYQAMEYAAKNKGPAYIQEVCLLAPSRHLANLNSHTFGVSNRLRLFRATRMLVSRGFIDKV